MIRSLFLILRLIRLTTLMIIDSRARSNDVSVDSADDDSRKVNLDI